MTDVDDYLRGYDEGYRKGHLSGFRRGRIAGLTETAERRARELQNSTPLDVHTSDTEVAGSELLT